MKYFLAIYFAFTSIAFSQVDFKYGANLRSYPSLGGDFVAELGYNQLLWGSSGSGPMYGLIRPSVEGSTSAVVSHYDSNLTFYPISFIGLGAGHKELTSNYEEFTYYDCDSVRCSGNLKKDYSFGKIALGYANLLTTFSYTEYRNTYSDKDNLNQAVSEYEYILVVNPKRENQIQRTYFLGYKLGENLMGMISDQIQFLESEKDYQLNIGIYQTQFGAFKTIFGIGTLQSSDQEPGVVGVLRLSHTLLPSLTLF